MRQLRWVVEHKRNVRRLVCFSGASAGRYGFWVVKRNYGRVKQMFDACFQDEESVSKSLLVGEGAAL
jgi:hypothetical protein